MLSSRGRGTAKVCLEPMKPAPHDLPGNEPATVYRVFADGDPIAALFVVSARDGYAGPIKLLIGIDGNGVLRFKSAPDVSGSTVLHIHAVDDAVCHVGNARWIAERIAGNEIRSIVINMEHAAFDQGLAKLLADKLGAPCRTLEDLHAESLYLTVLNQLD